MGIQKNLMDGIGHCNNSSTVYFQCTILERVFAIIPFELLGHLFIVVYFFNRFKIIPKTQIYLYYLVFIHRPTINPNVNIDTPSVTTRLVSTKSYGFTSGAE